MDGASSLLLFRFSAASAQVGDKIVNLFRFEVVYKRRHLIAALKNLHANLRVG